MNLENVAVVVAVGPLNRGKSRLGPMLIPTDRRELVLAMLQDVFASISQVHRGPTFVVTPDPEVDPVAHALGAVTLRDAGEGTNAAIETAIADPRVTAADAVLVIQGDLPQLSGSDVERCLVALEAHERGALLVPAADGGTLVLGIRPPMAMDTAFGPDSGDRHRVSAAMSGVPLEELEIAGLVDDVDTIADLERVRARVGPATAAVLKAISVGIEDGAAP